MTIANDFFRRGLDCFRGTAAPAMPSVESRFVMVRDQATINLSANEGAVFVFVNTFSRRCATSESRRRHWETVKTNTHPSRRHQPHPCNCSSAPLTKFCCGTQPIVSVYTRALTLKAPRAGTALDCH